MRFALGFTLIELLVVVAVIAILAGLLFPLLAKVRERAHQAVCLSNLKQIGGAFDLYLRDWDDTYPLVSSGHWTWLDALLPYLSNTQVLVCPGNPYNPSGPTLTPPASSYAMNWYFPSGTVALDLAGTLKDDPLLHANIPQPSILILVADSRFGYYVQDASANLWARPGLPPSSWLPYGKGHLNTHLGRVSFLFCDGHVSAMKMADTLYPVYMWRIDNLGRPEERDQLEQWRSWILKTLDPEYR